MMDTTRHQTMPGDAATRSAAEGGGRAALAAGGAGLLAALGISTCCTLPLLLTGIGLGGAWIGGLGVFAAYQPLFLVLGVAALAAGFYVSYRPQTVACGPDGACAAAPSRRWSRIAVWAAAKLFALSLVAPYLLEGA